MGGLWQSAFRIVLCLVYLGLVTPALAGPNLQSSRITKEYREVLCTALRAFVLWLSLRSLPKVGELVLKPQELQERLVDYLQYMFDSGASLSAGRNTVLALQTFHRQLRGQLLLGWDSVRSWEQLRPGSMRIPIPHLIVEALFSYAVAMGFRLQGDEGRNWFCFGIGTLCAFNGLLRPGELAKLNAEHICLPTTRLHDIVSKAVLCIRNPKNRKSLGRQQVATCDDPRLILWLEWLCRGLDPKARVFPGGTLRFRRYMATALEALGLASIGFTPGGLRAGGTTHLFILGTEVARLRILGRWKVMQTLDHYVQEAAATLALIRIDDLILGKLTRLKSGGSRFARPPQFAWEDFFSRDKQSSEWTVKLSLARSAPPRLL